MNDVDASWPLFAKLSPQLQEYYCDATLKGRYALDEGEKDWCEVYHFFHSYGYALRSRYAPGWVPSWTGTDRNPAYCTDSLRPLRSDFMDCIRLSDSRMVGIKHTTNKTEVEIAQFLASQNAQDHRLNHCVPLFLVLPHPNRTQEWFLFMPLLRPFNDPRFVHFGEIIDFISQVLEGLEFMHRNRVAHRDCAAFNIMMDGNPLYPKGFHPVLTYATPDLFEQAEPRFRIDHPVRYYFIDFGMSSHFPIGIEPMVTGNKGRDRDVPELSVEVPYDAYKADVYILGNTLRQEIVEGYQGTSPLDPLVKLMTRRLPSSRPTIAEARACFRDICSRLPSGYERTRVYPQGESLEDRLGKESVKLLINGIDKVGRALVGP